MRYRYCADNLFFRFSLHVVSIHLLLSSEMNNCHYIIYYETVDESYLKIFIGITNDNFYLHINVFTFKKKVFLKRIPAYPISAPNTNKMQDKTHAERALNPSTFGDVVGILLKILVRTKKRVTSKVILPGTTSGSIRKLT